MRIDAAHSAHVASNAELLIPVQGANVSVYLGCAGENRTDAPKG